MGHWNGDDGHPTWSHPGSAYPAVPAVARCTALLLGVQYHLQAVVIDPAAGNPLRAVMSDAHTAVVGRG